MNERGSWAARVVAILLLIAGLLLLAVGIVYFALPADKLPSFMGRIAHVTAHRTKRATAGVVAGGLFLVVSLITFWGARARR